MASKKTTTKKNTADRTPAAAPILVRPRITEKAATLGQQSIYLFDVAVTATKNEIAKAFYARYQHKPLKVTTVRKRPKSFFRRGVLGFGARTKKAYIVLPKGITIALE
ncbi:MAG TPA: 50S ribosomal protein L23 [Candidatus Paceibacterota bacterium]|nr:50S ribosomal protein L23 [Candidatus Paceibacterota bacterium]